MKIWKIILRWVLIFVLPILILYFALVYTYNPCELCEGDKHRHTMGPWFGFFILSYVWGIVCIVGLFIEIVYKYFRNKYK